MENKNVRTIGVLTSGGDAPGMNAAIRSVVRVGSYYGLKVFGVRRGYNGLINGELEEMNARSVSEILQRGGTILQTARCLEFKEEAGVKKAVEIAKVFGLDGLVVVGGDGSFRGARDLCAAGLPTIALPGTIDNDISCSEYTVGYDTCLNTVKDAVDKIRDTAQSHERCSIIEVMGRAAGYIAIQAGIACGAEVILVPERKWSFDEDVLRPILGHVQRGGSPTVRDRVVASEMGCKAVELLLEGKQNRIVCMQQHEIVDVDIEEGLAMKKELPQNLVDLAKKLTV